MDTLDHLHASQDTAEQGIQLRERPEIPPQFHAGNQLSDALEIAEAEIGPHLTALLLQAVLKGHHVPNTDRASLDLIDAVQKFRRNVSPADFETRLKTRIFKLLRPD